MVHASALRFIRAINYNHYHKERNTLFKTKQNKQTKNPLCRRNGTQRTEEVPDLSTSATLSVGATKPTWASARPAAGATLTTTVPTTTTPASAAMNTKVRAST